jgi:hypothetical protein
VSKSLSENTNKFTSKSSPQEIFFGCAKIYAIEYV